MSDRRHILAVPGLRLSPAHDRKMVGLIFLVGGASGLASMGYLGLLWMLSSVLGPESTPPTVHFLIMTASGLGVALLIRILGNPGDVELLVDNIHVLGGSRDLRDVRSLIPVSLLCIASGGAAGPEAPLVQTTGSLGTWVSQRSGLGVSDRRILTITGMAAGFTALFGAPLGATIFALEILHRRGLEYYEALLPAIMGALCGFAVFVVASGLGLAPVWDFPDVDAIHRLDLLWAVPAGALGAIVAVAFTGMNAACRWAFDRLPVFVRPIVGGTLLGALAFWSPYALTFGESQTDHIMHLGGAAGVFVVAAIAKFIATPITISSGWRGGFIIPLFFIGACIARVWHLEMPEITNESVLAAALMAAINTGVTKTPIGSMLVVSEMAGLRLMPTTLIAAVISLVLTSRISLIHSQRTRDSLNSPSDADDPS